MKNNAIINLALIVIIGGYLFFFTSNLWIPHNASAKKQTPLNESVEWADRAITIERWDYCERSRLMEVYMDIKDSMFIPPNLICLCSITFHLSEMRTE